MSALPDSVSPQPIAVHRLERWTLRAREGISALPHLPFFAGILLGFVACAVAGRVVSDRPMFERFVRFHGAIQSGQFFYPTASQLAAHVRHAAAGGRIPVVVGGASYFRGTGQNPTEVWTLELQRLLGERYVVINFAVDQAPLTAFAAVAFQIISREFPDALYVSDGNPLAGGPWDGGDEYGYVFWDAWYKGKLLPSVTSSARIQEFGRQQRRKPAGLELHLGKQLDRFAYACDLWGYIAYKHVFTVWADQQWRNPHWPRRLESDGNDPNIRQTQLNIRQDAGYVRHSEDHGRKSSRYGFVQAADGTWAPDQSMWERLAGEWRNLFPDELRSRCLVVFLRGNPYFMQTFTDDDRRRTEQQYVLGQKNLESVGYRVVQLRAADFTADDFLDGGHYVASGGVKIAQAVAAAISNQ